ncbi:MAG: hypothetical protein ACI4QR_00800, partial [Eubacteriales bacterium]
GGFPAEEENMNIRKGDAEYSIKEFQNYWRITKGAGKLTIEYKVAKDICGTIEELKQYIEKESMF